MEATVTKQEFGASREDNEYNHVASFHKSRGSSRRDIQEKETSQANLFDVQAHD